MAVSFPQELDMAPKWFPMTQQAAAKAFLGVSEILLHHWLWKPPSINNASWMSKSWKKSLLFLFLLTQVQDYVKEPANKRDDISAYLCQQAKDKGSTDNITVVVVFLRDEINLLSPTTLEEEGENTVEAQGLLFLMKFWLLKITHQSMNVLDPLSAST